MATSDEGSPVTAPAASAEDGPGLISRGERGPVGAGERGPTGDPGRDGRDGRQGLRGAAGVAGLPADIVRTVRNAQRTRLLFVFVVALFLSMAAVLQNNTNGVKAAQHAVAVTAYDSCNARNANIVKLNTTFDALAQIEQTNPYKAGDIGMRRVKVYTDAKFVVIDCGKRP